VNNIKTVTKPWGKEEWIELNESYCYKRIYINKGYKTSFQYHERKLETNYIISGTAEVWLENENGIIEKTIKNSGDYFNVIPPRKHRVIAITDIILQEVSTPEVDDVIRIEDDTSRKNGRIKEEHIKPAILILSAGLGSRLEYHTEFKNKALIPIDNKAIISHVIEKFPKDYEIIIAVGYKKESIKEYCNLAHADREIKFVDVDKWEDSKTDPGYSTFLCKEYLQKPFYLISVDTLINSDIPNISENWIGTAPTNNPERYATVKIENENVSDIINKSSKGFENAFIGLAAILEYKTFWQELENNSTNFELISAWKNPQKYSSLKVKELKWLDTGNLEDFDKTKLYFKEECISSLKAINEVFYKVNNFILKFNPNKEINKNKSLRSEKLINYIPKNFEVKDFFIKYDWEIGNDLYCNDSLSLYLGFLEFLNKLIINSNKWNIDKNLIDCFYKNKTTSRKDDFIKKYGEKYLTNRYKINNIEYPSLGELLNKIDYSIFLEGKMYDNFHGDLHFDNIIYNENEQTYKYIDWRDSFNGDVLGGDLYYDLAKLYAGCLFPFILLKSEDQIKYAEYDNNINYKYDISKNILEFTKEYENWLDLNQFNKESIKLLTGLVFLNIAPLHTDIFNKIFLSKSIELLYGSL
jgi:choline kinase/mannose-6-phosphate isomerase-like protein (cupin superfamily)